MYGTHRTSIQYTFKRLPISLHLSQRSQLLLSFFILFYFCCCICGGMMELQLGLALSAYAPSSVKEKLPWTTFESDSCYVKKKNKRGFGVAFEKNEDDDEVSAGKGLPLLLWNGQPNGEDDRNGLGKRASDCPINKNGEEGNEVVGWPPVKSWRRKLMCQHQRGRMVPDLTVEKESAGSGPTYVKVKMEGVAIARKINLKLYQSYRTLTNSLIAMFARCKKCDVDCVHYTLTYQDKEGDWLIAGDVPWKTFIESVQRLELVRNGG